jgi:hypothetical protein
MEIDCPPVDNMGINRAGAEFRGENRDLSAASGAKFGEIFPVGSGVAPLLGAFRDQPCLTKSGCYTPRLATASGPR